MTQKKQCPQAGLGEGPWTALHLHPAGGRIMGQGLLTWVAHSAEVGIPPPSRQPVLGTPTCMLPSRESKSRPGSHLGRGVVVVATAVPQVPGPLPTRYLRAEVERRPGASW